jgi:hypothetical protein
VSLLSPAQLSSIQKLGEKGMITDVTIIHFTSDTGLDESDDPYGSITTQDAVTTSARGWLVGRWSNNRNYAIGDVDTTTTYRLRLPVGTEIEVGWRVAIDGNEYNVVDVGSDQTWPEWLVCLLLRNK